MKDPLRTDLYPMLSVEDALARLLNHFHALEPERVSILETLGRVLAEDVYSDIDIPPHANTAMDGYASRAADIVGASTQNPKRLRVIENLAAGHVTDTEITPGTAIRIMTGAPIPPGADTVIRFERTEQEGEWVDVLVEVAVGKNIRLAGEDVGRGTLVLSKGTRIRPQEIGMLASLGRTKALVIRRPRVAILATGDELVEIDAPLTPGKIHDANAYSNAAQVIKYGGIPVMLGIAQDQIAELTAKIKVSLEKGADLLLTSGGVSVGDFDVVKSVLAAEGEIGFWRVRMKPGKPLAFGRIETSLGGATRSVPVLGMPGNPVSAMVSFEMFARPAILTMLGVTDLKKRSVEAVLESEIERKDNRRHFVRVRVEKREHVEDDAPEYRAFLTGSQGSGILNSMVKANGLAIIPEDWPHAPAGARVQVLMFD